jgi:hypothetical protein
MEFVFVCLFRVENILRHFAEDYIHYESSDVKFNRRFFSSFVDKTWRETNVPTQRASSTWDYFIDARQDANKKYRKHSLKYL